MLDEILNYCHIFYNRSRDGCFFCPNSDCQGSCNQCLNSIHYDTITRTYNCLNIAKFYILKYAPKYSSEIDWILYFHKIILQKDNLKIFSFGCGPCTDLIGIIRNIKRTGNIKNVEYVGFEMNEIWKPIHDIYKQYNTSVGDINIVYKFSYTDALISLSELHLENTTLGPDILIFQYFVADKSLDKNNIQEFFSNVINKIIDFMPLGSYIIFNDINHSTKSTDWFETFVNIFEKDYIFQISRGHFINQETKFGYGIKHKNNKLTCEDPDVVGGWKICTSAYMIIKILEKK